jgi:hypothetical protein
VVVVDDEQDEEELDRMDAFESSYNFRCVAKLEHQAGENLRWGMAVCVAGHVSQGLTFLSDPGTCF